MAGREFLFQLFRRAARPAVALTLVAVCLAAAGAVGLRQVTAQRPSRATASAALTLTASLSSQSIETGGKIIALGEFEGSFDPSAQQLTVTPVSADFSGSKVSRRFSLQSRSDANTTLPSGSFTFRVMDTNGPAPNSIFFSSGEMAGTVSAETEIVNNTTYTFYNTRLVFTDFRQGNASGAAASNSPATGGLAFYNDGQVVFNNRLNVSRNYGDIAPNGASGRAIWTFAAPTSGPTFYFRFQLLADLGVAAESVEPAAAQVNASTGSSVLIHGRGFTGTPTVELLNGAGVTVAILPVSNATATQLTAAIPAGTAPGTYGLRVTNPGGTAGGIGSSAILGRLTVTGVPDGAHTLAGPINFLPDTGPYLIVGAAAITADVTILPGTVFYFANGASLQVQSSGNLTANGGIPGVTNGAGISTPRQIVFTADRQPGTALPVPSAWGGIQALSSSAAKMIFRNCVIEYAGQENGAQIDISHSGRTLQFTDSIARKGAGAGLAAMGNNDRLTNFARSRIESNGLSPEQAAVKLSANASLGLYDLDGTTGGTSVSDANFYYSSANVFTGNGNNAIQIGMDEGESSNDWTRSGVLVGQGDTPIEIRGMRANPAIIGNNTQPGAELTIGPNALIHLAPGTDLQAGDLRRGLFGAIAANGFAGVTQVPNAAFGSSRYITFDKTRTGSNFGAIFFSRNAATSSILNFVRVVNGGAGGLGQAQVITDGVNVRLKNSQITNSATGGILQTSGGFFDTFNTDLNGNSILIDTIAGGLLGDGNLATRAHLATPVAVARDPLGRGIYVVDLASIYFIRFINTSTDTVTIAGQVIPPGVMRTVAGGGSDFGDGAPGLQADLGIVTGVAVNATGELLYFIDQTDPFRVRALNVSANTVTLTGAPLAAGTIGTLSTGLGFSLNALAVHPVSGDVYVADAASGGNKVFKIDANGVATTVAGNGANTRFDDPLESTTNPTAVALLQPRAIVFDPAGNLYIADSGHGRILRVSTTNQLSLIEQMPAGGSGSFPAGLAFFNSKLYVANGNDQTIVRLIGGNATIAGTVKTACTYDGTTCGDGGLAAAATFDMLGSTGVVPLAGITADATGLYILDQGNSSRGRVRYLNLSGAPVTIAGVTINSNRIDTIAGTGSTAPYDGGLATSGALNVPTGVAVDANNNLYITESLGNRLRFVNRGLNPVTIFAGTAAQQVVPAGGIVTVNKEAGIGASDGVPVNQAGFDTPQGIAVTAQGIFIADSRKGPTVTVPGNLAASRRTGVIRFINTTSATVTFYPSTAFAINVPPGGIATIVGGGVSLSSIGDNGFALDGKLIGPADVAIHPVTGDIYIADTGNNAVRKVDRNTGTITSVSGLAAAKYTGLAFDSSGRLHVTNHDTNHVLRQTASGSSTFTQMDAGAGVSRPKDLVLDAAGNAYVTNSGNHQIIRISVTGNISTIAGTTRGFSGDPGLAASAQLDIAPDDINVKPTGTPSNVPRTVGIALSATGEIIFADSDNSRIRRLR
jgi:sugar lactone lactonase YvrE